MGAHTPGPWEIYRDGDIRHIVRAGSVSYPSPAQTQADWIAEINPDGTDHDDATTEANAHLIAAAPLLLAACEAAYAWLNNNRSDETPAIHAATAWKMCRAALAAARGEEAK